MVRTHTKKIAAFMSVVTMLYLMMMYFPSGMLGIDFGLTASAAEITLTEPSTDSNGVYQIGSAAELYWFADKINNDNATYASANAALTANINLHGSETNQWTPIGNDTNQFKGIFDGGGHRITGLYISSTSNYQGLFGYLGSGGMIKSLGVDGSVSGGSNVGGVCGYNKGGTITGCYNTGAVTGGSFVGGVCGPNSGTITGCYNSGTVSGTFSDALESGSKTVGGVCSSNSSTITGCYNTGAVTGTNKYTGGVCGSNSGTISGCYNTGAVTGTVSYNSDEAVVGGDDTTRGVGGVCGYNYGSTIESCYNTGAVTGTSDYVGGVCGYNKTYTTIIGNTYTGTTTGCYNIGTVTCSNIFSTNVGGVCGYNGGTTEDCYYLSGCKGTLTTFNSVGTAISVAEFTNHTNFSGWDFSATWKMSDYLERPILSSVPEIKGDGTEMQPYLISDLASLERLRDDVNGGKDYSGVYFALTADIYMSGTYNSTSGKSWTPIGNDKNQFKGIFNGGGHKIIGLYISGTSNYQGLFGYLGEGGMIKSLGVDGSVSGGTDVGGVCGGNLGTITGCYNTGTVSGNSYIGGVCGVNFNSSTITGCYNIGTVSGAGNFVGGVGGLNGGGTITGCYNTGTVSSTSEYVGGVCGRNNSGKITKCYNTAAVTGSGTNVGGVCGYNYITGATITRCYYDSDKCKVGGITGADTANKAEGKTSKQFASGEVCYLLNGGRITLLWGQTIGKESGNDAYPVFHNDTNTVYYGYADCSAADKTYSNSALHETMGHKYNGENHACSYCGNAFAVIEVNYAKLENALTDIYNVDSDGNVGKKADITVDKDTGVVTCLIKVNGDKALIDTYTLNISASEGETNPITIEKTKYKKRSGENSINIDMVQLVNELANGSYTATLILYDADGNDICIINADFAVSSGTISAG